MDDYGSYWYKPTVNEYLKKSNVDVITVSWGKHAKYIYYPNSVRAVQAVSQHIADTVLEVFEKYAVPIENFHLIGHSLGAHIAGFVGKTVDFILPKNFSK